MTHPIGLAIDCGDLATHVRPAVASLERQMDGTVEIMLVTSARTPAPLRGWIEAFAASRGISATHAPSDFPGAVRNAALAAMTAPVIAWMNADERLAQGCPRTWLADFAAHPTIDAIVAGIGYVPPSSDDSETGLQVTGPDALVDDASSGDGVLVVRRDAWSRAGGFDEHLPALEAYDFLLRLCEGGDTYGRDGRRAVTASWRRQASSVRVEARDRRDRALRTIIRRHPAFATADIARLLFARQRALRDLRLQNEALIARREQAAAQVNRLEARVAALREDVPSEDRDRIDFGDLRRTSPLSRDWGYERGAPIDRQYIEQFLSECAGDIQGTVLEIQEPDYTQRFGGSRVSRSEVLDLDAANPRATIVSDLRCAANIASDTFDCIILTQTLHVIDDMPAALAECHRILRPGGVLLATLPSASRVCLEYGPDGDFWRVTEAGARRLLASSFPAAGTEVIAHGNVFVNMAFLYGFATHEVTAAEFDATDPYFPLLITVRAVKPPLDGTSELPGRARRRSTASAQGAGAVLLYHRIADVSPDTHHLAVPVDKFRAQLAHLRDRYHVMPLGEFARSLREQRLPANAVALAFDDGYLDNFSVASPLLTEFRVPATFFLTTDHLDHDDRYEYWWDVLERCLMAGVDGRAPVLDARLPAGNRRLMVSTQAERFEAHRAIYEAIVGAPAEARDAAIESVRTWRGDVSMDLECRRMTAAEIRTLAGRDGHDIGAHTVRHLMLPSQPAEVQQDEVVRSRRTLEALTGRSVTTFAYPFGAFNDSAVAAVAAAGFEAAVTCEARPVGDRESVLRLPRLDVAGRPDLDFDRWLARALART